ncbi:uncharacterized protein [Euphorbia lathyris]|uniref:uncharacterized protein n=1 Tax=Euphorbia lathyris TaxID=212925 RepID=UPI0033135DC9
MTYGRPELYEYILWNWESGKKLCIYILMEDEHMHDQDDSSDSSESQGNASKKNMNFKPRGPSKGLKEKVGVVRDVEWDEFYRHRGKCAQQFKAHIGTTTRSKVSILIDAWSKVPQGLNDTLWLDVKREFQMEENEEYKKSVTKVL